MRVFLCEKPSQARDIARELGNPRDKKTHLETDGGIVTFAFGHLLQLCDPSAYDPKYEKWNLMDLPIFPKTFRVEQKPDSAAQLSLIGKLLKTASEVVIATDADREGEMIAREIMEYWHYAGPVSRLWLSALDPESVRKALGRLKVGEETQSLYHAALARSRADWLVGMNMSRAATLADRASSGRSGTVSIGRVQTPTLALVVRRDREVEAFVSRDYFEVVATVDSNGSIFTMKYAPRDDERIYERQIAESIASSAKTASGPLSVIDEKKEEGPPKLFSLSALQSAVNAKWGWSADKTLKMAQALYETHKVTTYPRSDCHYLPEEQIQDVGTILNLLRVGILSELPAWEPVIRKQVFNTAKISAHHAIIPTKQQPTAQMSPDETKLYKLIAASYAAATMPNYEYRSIRASMQAGGVVFEASGSTPLVDGWKAAFRATGSLSEEKGNLGELPNLKDKDSATISDTAVEGKKTKPPARYTEGTLIESMKSVARFVTDPAKKAKLRETSGIGTEATRAAILTTLQSREFIAPSGKFVISTTKGRELIGWLEDKLPVLADPAETAVWEDGLEGIVTGSTTLDKFVSDIGGTLQEHVKIVKRRIAQTECEMVATEFKCPKSNEPVLEGATSFKFSGFPEVCFGKEFVGRKMNGEEWVSVVAGEGREFQGFYSQTRKKHFGARLRLDQVAGKVVFDFGASKSIAPVEGHKCPKSLEPVLDRGSHFFFPGFPAFRAWKTVAQREMTPGEYVSILAGTSEIFEGFVSKAGKKFSAKLVFDTSSQKTNFQFDSK